MKSAAINSVIRDTDARGRPRTRIRIGKDEIEIPGGDDELKAWLAEQEAAVTPAHVTAIYLKQQADADPTLKTLDAVVGKEATLELSEKAVEAVTHG